MYLHFPKTVTPREQGHWHNRFAPNSIAPVWDVCIQRTLQEDRDLLQRLGGVTEMVELAAVMYLAKSRAENDQDPFGKNKDSLLVFGVA